MQYQSCPRVTFRVQLCAVWVLSDLLSYLPTAFHHLFLLFLLLTKHPSLGPHTVSVSYRSLDFDCNLNFRGRGRIEHTIVVCWDFFNFLSVGNLLDETLNTV